MLRQTQSATRSLGLQEAFIQELIQEGSPQRCRQVGIRPTAGLPLKVFPTSARYICLPLENTEEECGEERNEHTKCISFSTLIWTLNSTKFYHCKMQGII